MTQATSAIFSLQELARMEEERVRGLAEAAEQERAAGEQLRRETAERARREDEERLRAEAAARAEIERRAREDAARIEAIHRAAVEAARIEAEARVARESREAEHRRAVDDARAGLASRGRGTRSTLAGAALGFVLALGGSMTVYFGVLAPTAHARAAFADTELAARDVTIADVRRSLAELQTRSQAQDAELASLRSADTQLRADLDAARRAPPAHGPAVHFTGPAHVSTGPRLDGFTACPPGSQDPLCLR